MSFKETTIGEIPSELREYLLSITDRSKGEQIPVYYRPKESDDVFFIKDYILKDNSVFEKSAPAELYRGGGILLLKTKEGFVTLFDDRYHWLKMPGGIAQFNEGNDLMATAIREAIIEELVILKNDESLRLVPQNLGRNVDKHIDNWDVTVPDAKGCGKTKIIDIFFNEKNRAIEVVAVWDLSKEDTDLVILHNEDWFRGGDTGFAPMVIDKTGSIVGIYSGRQGYVAFPIPAGGIKLHPTLEKVLAAF